MTDRTAAPNDRLAEIKGRHKAFESLPENSKIVFRKYSKEYFHWHQDRDWLIAEVERLRNALARIEECYFCSVSTKRIVDEVRKND